jgi:hypothetical protein
MTKPLKITIEGGSFVTNVAAFNLVHDALEGDDRFRDVRFEHPLGTERPLVGTPVSLLKTLQRKYWDLFDEPVTIVQDLAGVSGYDEVDWGERRILLDIAYKTGFCAGELDNRDAVEAAIKAAIAGLKGEQDGKERSTSAAEG